MEEHKAYSADFKGAVPAHSVDLAIDLAEVGGPVGLPGLAAVTGEGPLLFSG
jgi:hypothetical protein